MLFKFNTSKPYYDKGEIVEIKIINLNDYQLQIYTERCYSHLVAIDQNGNEQLIARDISLDFIIKIMQFILLNTSSTEIYTAKSLADTIIKKGC